MRIMQTELEGKTWLYEEVGAQAVSQRGAVRAEGRRHAVRERVSKLYVARIAFSSSARLGPP
jgi:hypothetical protein